MTRLFVAFALLSLAACQITGTAGPSGTASWIETARARVEAACRFRPTAQTVIDVFATFDATTKATTDVLGTMAVGICAAASGGSYASTSRSRSDEPRGTYRNVRVRGQNVKER